MAHLIVQTTTGFVRVFERNAPDSPFDAATEIRVDYAGEGFDRDTKRWDVATGTLRDATPAERPAPPEDTEAAIAAVATLEALKAALLTHVRARR